MLPILAPDPENLRQAAQRLKAGELVAFPTETVYGLGANALDAGALAKIFAAKNRPFFDPLIIHVSDVAWVERLCTRIDARARRLMGSFWPGPLTLVLPKTALVPDLATSGLPSVAVRMPSHPVALALLRETGFPLAAPSANPFGRLSPTSAAHVQAHFNHGDEGSPGGIALILDGGPCEVGVESTILSLTGETPVLLRAGGLAREDLEKVAGPVETPPPITGGAAGTPRPSAPGQLASHYAPRTKLAILPGRAPAARAARMGLLAFRESQDGYAAVEILSPQGDLHQAAANLFASLHRLDARGLDVIVAEPLPEEGLGLAIMDRLRRASA